MCVCSPRHREFPHQRLDTPRTYPQLFPVAELLPADFPVEC
ncbi:hypothetical protein I552_3563 [Mycobacterium xenopi 3993]|nr:hypothetical protein I552_3563 [Mycobacterium xenopi 3993]